MAILWTCGNRCARSSRHRGRWWCCARMPTMARSRPPAWCTNIQFVRGMPVVEVLVFAGERNVAASWLDNEKKATVREAEFRLECNILGAEAVCWNLEGYRMPGYQPTVADVEKVVEWFDTRRPGAVIVPPPNDAHVAHWVTRALTAIGLVVRAPERLPGSLGLDALGPASEAERVSYI